MALPSAQEAAAKWSQRASAASQDYVTGAQRTDKDPTALAIAAGPRYLQQVQQAYNSGKYAAGLRRAGRDGWLNGITTKGAQNYSTGVNAATEKFAAAIQSVLSYEQAGLSRLASMPANTDQERDARMNFWVQYMRQYVKPS
jgi:hypothetical protein